MSIVTKNRDEFLPDAGYATWRCFCGFQQDALAHTAQHLSGHPVPRTNEVKLLAALSQVERLRWELDIATFDLRVAVEEAIQGGASPVDIAATIDLGPDEMQLLVSQ